MVNNGLDALIIVIVTSVGDFGRGKDFVVASELEDRLLACCAGLQDVDYDGNQMGNGLCWFYFYGAIAPLEPRVLSVLSDSPVLPGSYALRRVNSEEIEIWRAQ